MGRCQGSGLARAARFGLMTRPVRFLFKKHPFNRHQIVIAPRAMMKQGSQMNQAALDAASMGITQDAVLRNVNRDLEKAVEQQRLGQEVTALHLEHTAEAYDEAHEKKKEGDDIDASPAVPPDDLSSSRLPRRRPASETGREELLVEPCARSARGGRSPGLDMMSSK